MGRAPCCDKENVKRGPWSPEEDAKLKGFIEKYGTGGNWIALPHKAGIIQETILGFCFLCYIYFFLVLALVVKFCVMDLNCAGLKRCGKSCRLRWLNYLRPNIKHGEFTDDEDRIICSLYASIGSRYTSLNYISSYHHQILGFYFFQI